VSPEQRARSLFRTIRVHRTIDKKRARIDPQKDARKDLGIFVPNIHCFSLACRLDNIVPFVCSVWQELIKTTCFSGAVLLTVCLIAPLELHQIVQPSLAQLTMN